LQGEGVTKIIALTHVGLPKDMEIAAAVDGIDAIVGGHSHTLMSNTEDGTLAYPTMVGTVPVVQAYAYSKYVGHLTLVFDDAGNVISATGDTILLDASVAEDEAAVARIAELAGPIEEMKTRIVAETAAAIDGDRTVCRAMECPMGSLIADAMLDRVRDQGVQIAIQNGGGIRASIDAGEVTMGEVLGVLPFQNTLSTFEVTGETLLAALENGVGQIEEGAGRFPQVAGMTFTVNSTAPAGERVSDVMVADAPLDPAMVYAVVSNNYVRNGGDGYAMFEDAANAYDFGPDLADVLAEYMAAQGIFTPYTDGRIIVN
jgi:5'-nucleotidase